jgi:Asp-tRNA(Asn)/Glu-tRNA(Gln) amidotransferase A subunit family amidase
VGPLARSLSSIELVTRELLGQKPWELDARVAPIPWRQEVYDEIKGRKLTIGVLMDDGVVRPHPPITRVLGSVVDKLREAGHDIVEWNGDLHAEGIEIMVRSPLSDSFLVFFSFSPVPKTDVTTLAIGPLLHRRRRSRHPHRRSPRRGALHPPR